MNKLFREALENIIDVFYPKERRAFRHAIKYWSCDGGCIMWKRY